jgi:hypothetical protein
MSTVALVALARPTFDLTCAQANFDSARALLTELGATVVGPADLVMTVEDVAAVTLPASRSSHFVYGFIFRCITSG